MEHKIMDGIGAHQQGYDDAIYDGIDTFGEFGCNCEKCKSDYEAGWNEGLEELERILLQHVNNFVPATPPKPRLHWTRRRHSHNRTIQGRRTSKAQSR